MSDRVRRPTAPDGLVVVDKPAGCTSHDVVARMRRLAGTRKVGHAGTLDPMATGVLVLGIGRATRLLTYVVGADKEYVATIRLGASTTTDDAEGELLTSGDASGVTRADIGREVALLTGTILQVPSSVSAIKIDGQRAYARVRAGENVEIAARPVTVSEFAVDDVRPVDARAGGAPGLDVDVRVVCSSGTYIRALARDIGNALGVGGHLAALRRTRVGPFTVEESRLGPDLDVPSIPEDAWLASAQAARRCFDAVDVNAAEAADVAHGRSLSRHIEGLTALIGPAGTLLALYRPAGDSAVPETVFVDGEGQ